MNNKQKLKKSDLFHKNSNSTEVYEEKEHFQRIAGVFKSYKFWSLKRLYSSMKYINSLPDHQRLLLNKYNSRLAKVKEAIIQNYEIIKLIVESLSDELLNSELNGDIITPNVTTQFSNVTQFDMEKLQSMLKQIYREWSAEAKDERDASFKPIIDEILLLFPPDKVSVGDIQVLVPGAALGRLPYEIAKRGYTCQGNEYSLFMIFTSNFILNKCHGENLYQLYPWVHQYHDNLKASDQLQIVSFPDANPFDLPPGMEFSMAAGSYTEVYQDRDKWDCIASCFFLDTGHNVVDYLETTWKILKPGGYFINLGPLLYHHADVPGEDSIEPSYEEIREIIIELGFNIIKEDLNLSTPYSYNPNSMMHYTYKSVFFVCQKPHSNNSCTVDVAKD